jgi:hypothetical protein
MKKVVFIGGTAHSASTLLDLMLSNNPSVFSIGEVSALFYPLKSHHINPICGYGSENCPEWTSIKVKRKKYLYATIFKRHPEIDTIVDSSKDVTWIKDQTKRLESNNIGIPSLSDYLSRSLFNQLN